MEIKRVYMDNSGTTPAKKEVVEAMMPYFTEHFGNPSSIHFWGQDAKGALDTARRQVAALFNANPEEIFFTGGGSEADNWAIKGVAFSKQSQGKHIITSKIEHHAVLHTCEYLQKHHGFEITYVDVDSEGIIKIEDLKEAIRHDTILITIMFGNNEIGSVQPIAEIGSLAREKGILFHTDAVQAVGNMKIDVKELPIDMLSASGHKIHAPKGIGILYIKKGIKIENLIHGGGQEKKRRAGTENMTGIVGMGKACEILTNHLEQHIAYVKEIRDYLLTEIPKRIPHTIITGSLDHRLPTVASFCFKFIEGEALLLSLDMVGIAGSSGSACTSGSLDPSHVLMAIGLKHEIAHGSLRLSLSDLNTMEEADYVLEQLPPIIERLRKMSPLYEDFLKGVDKYAL